VSVKVTLQGHRLQGEVRLEDLPEGWTSTPPHRSVELAEAGQSATSEFVVRTSGAQAGEIHALTVAVDHGDGQRRVPAQVLVAEAPLVREAEAPLVREAEGADEISGAAAVRDAAEISGAGGLEFGGNGRLAMDFTAPRSDTYALWLRARWSPEGDSSLSLSVDGASPRPLRIERMIGFEDWTAPNRAHTKRFHTEQYDHWAWYRIPDVTLTPGKHRLTISAGRGAWLDALALLPQDNTTDRAAMNLFQNWNFAPWHNPF
jgi:hypothetical protein